MEYRPAANPKIRGEKMPKDEFTTWLEDNPPAESITVKVEYAEGKETLFHFKRVLFPSDRAAELLLLDTVHEDERETLAAFLKSYPGRATFVSNALLDVYYDDLAVGITNVTQEFKP